MSENIEARQTQLSSQLLGLPLTNALFFFSVVLLGSAYIVMAKLWGFTATSVTFVPVTVMFAYALLIGAARSLRLRDDQSGDNLYYMGFLFTLTSLGVSLYQFNANGAAEQIVQNFGVAIASTIAGIALRVFFNQMRRDPIEVEATARLELAEASRKVRRELDYTIQEFSYFRRAAQQMIMDGFEETKLKVDEVGQNLLSGLEDVTRKSAEPLEAASRKSGMTVDEMTRRIVASLESSALKLSDGSAQLSDSATKVAETLDVLSAKLSAMQTPEQIIEIKLTPVLQGVSRAVNSFGKSADAQTSAINQAVEGARAATESAVSLAASFHSQFATVNAESRAAAHDMRAAAESAAGAAQAASSTAASSASQTTTVLGKIDEILRMISGLSKREKSDHAPSEQSP
ncbi:hypothetical protein Msil_1541 [Methylocella silvestris BL2]|uniref:Methyl-accepting chemotaxis protein n=1 Tax=Methylocella silvestris (strain DSM 15510 / CIP 108128 / LMG 27833 / NCIMB 13906 / BL2) TaxID=395965 RepID=B8EI09_METSB|nr:hypothetical protein [Methylocella silvestris]ACK50491.1 hypothetical protein Msil_1541 [Methylocella silvestris BL2]